MPRLVSGILAVVLTLEAAIAACCSHEVPDSHEETIEASRIELVQTRLDVSSAKRPDSLEDAKKVEAASVPSALPWWDIVPSHPANFSYDCGGDVIRLFAGNAPGDSPERVQKPEFFGYQEIDPVRDFCCPGAPGPVFANVVTPELVAFMVDKDDANRTDVGVLVFPGGGGNIVVWNYEGVEIAKWLNSIGINAFVLKYRVPAHAQYRGLPVADAQRALSKVRHDAASLGLNASRIGTLGFSFGGSLAYDLSNSAERSYAGTDDVDTVEFRPDFQILVYPDDPWLESVSSRRQPPTFIASARDDKCTRFEAVEEISQAIYRTGQEVVDFHLFSEGQHGFGNCKYTASGHFELVCNWLMEASMFIRRYVLKEVW